MCWDFDDDLGLSDPDVVPFRGKELCYLALFFSGAVLLLVIMYEVLMPVFNNPTYPFYNHVLDYSYHPSVKGELVAPRHPRDLFHSSFSSSAGNQSL
ncbi:unnamed protein product, partial [Mesorhabditis belari]|uniref:Uncharacterized protein n=1 Tax=Mesorhabditis belari TaxID=2138241 RepID=A0AAF3F5M5_9BILA